MLIARSLLAVLLSISVCAACTGGGSSSGESSSSGSSGSTSSGSPGSSGSSGSMSSGSPGSSGSSGSMSSGSSGSNEGAILCGSDRETCACGKDPGQFPGADAKTTPCSTQTVGGAARCCATNQWPASGRCFCNSVSNCHRGIGSDVCICGLAEPGPGEETVSSCTGQLCCQTPSDVAPICACYTTLSTCPSGATAVPSCSTASLPCEGKNVSDCR
jgi:hypothetical protein